MRRIPGVLLLIFFSVALTAAQQNEPSLAEIAKETPRHKATHVITNDDIPPSPDVQSDDASNAGPDQESGAQGSGERSAAAVPAVNSKGSSEVQALQQQIDTLNKNLAERQARTAEYQQRMAEETDDFRRDTEQTVLAARQAEEQRMIQQRDQLQQKLDAAKQKNEKTEEKQEQKQDEKHSDAPNRPASPV